MATGGSAGSGAVAGSSGSGASAGSGGSGGTAGSGASGGVGGVPNTSCADPSSAWSFTALPDGLESFVPRRQLWGAAPNDVWLIGDEENELYRFDGATWKKDADLSFEGFYPQAITGWDTSLYLASPMDVLKCAPGCTPMVTVKGALTSMVATAPETLWLAFGDGIVRRQTASGDKDYFVAPFETVHLEAMDGQGEDIYVVGGTASAKIYHRSASFDDFLGLQIKDAQGQPVPSNGMKDVVALGGGEAIAVGWDEKNLPLVAHLTGDDAQLIPFVVPTDEFGQFFGASKVWASSAKDIYVIVETIGGPGPSYAHVAHYDGTSWTLIDPLTVEKVAYSTNLDVWGLDAQHVYVASSWGVHQCAID